MAIRYHHCVFIPRLGLSVFRTKGKSKARRLHMIHDGSPEILPTYATFPAASTGCKVALLKLRSLQITYDDGPAWFDWHRLHDVQAANRAPCSLEILKMNSGNQADVPSFGTNLTRRFVISRPRRSKASILTILDLFRRSGVCCAGRVWRHHWRLAEFCVYVLGINGLTFWRNPVWMARSVWMGKTTKEQDTNSSHPCQNTQIYGCVGEYGCMAYLYNQDILWVSCFSHVWTNLNFNKPLYLIAGHNMSHHSASALLCTSMITT